MRYGASMAFHAASSRKSNPLRNAIAYSVSPRTTRYVPAAGAFFAALSLGLVRGALEDRSITGAGGLELHPPRSSAAPSANDPAPVRMRAFVSVGTDILGFSVKEFEIQSNQDQYDEHAPGNPLDPAMQRFLDALAAEPDQAAKK